MAEMSDYEAHDPSWQAAAVELANDFIYLRVVENTEFP